MVSPSNITIESDLVLKLLVQKDQVRFFLREMLNGSPCDASISPTGRPAGSPTNSIAPTASTSSGDEGDSISSDPVASSSTHHSNISSEEVFLKIFYYII